MAIVKNTYTLSEVVHLWKSGNPLEIPQEILSKVNSSSAFLGKYLSESEQPVYGINTGFGSLQNVEVPEHDLQELQRNLLITHAAGFGDLLPDGLVRLMLLLKVLNISKGFSAVRVEVLERLIWFYNKGYSPRVHSQGSLGASGDLAPLSELSLPLIGKGNLSHKAQGVIPTDVVLKNHGLKALILEPKEALALINGTQFMLAHAIYTYCEAEKIIKKINTIGAFSADMFLCRKEPHLPQLHTVRPHNGQINCAIEILENLESSELGSEKRPAVQDPYSFRCMPQVHGASLDALKHCFGVWETELNSVTDNPTVFEEDNLVISGGNFHGQPLALTMDYAAIALAELASISERRTYLLISGQRGLPAFLSPNPGTDSGYMIAQYSAASAVSQNKQLCSPASVDSIMSSNGQEDHVSMGANAGIKLLQVVKNTKLVLAVEMLCATQARYFRDKETFPKAKELADEMGIPIDAHQYDPMYALMRRSSKILWGDSAEQH